MTHMKLFQSQSRIALQFYAYRDVRSMRRAVDRFCGPRITQFEGPEIASAPAVFNVPYMGEPGWDRCGMFLWRRQVDDVTIWHEANHMSRCVVEAATSGHKKGARVKPPKGVRGDRLTLWYEEMECYLQTGIAQAVLRWRDLGFPVIKDTADLHSLKIPVDELSLWDPVRMRYLT